MFLYQRDAGNNTCKLILKDFPFHDIHSLKAMKMPSHYSLVGSFAYFIPHLKVWLTGIGGANFCKSYNKELDELMMDKWKCSTIIGLSRSPLIS